MLALDYVILLVSSLATNESYCCGYKHIIYCALLFIQEGEIWLSDDCSKEYTCRADGTIEENEVQCKDNEICVLDEGDYACKESKPYRIQN